MIAARLSILFLLTSMAIDAAQSDQAWTGAGIKNGVTLAFRDDPQLNARQVRAVAELPHAPGEIVPVVCDFTQILDPDTREARVLSGEIGGRYEIYLRYAPRYLVVSARDVVLDVRPEADGCAWSEVAGPCPAAIRRRAHAAAAWIVDGRADRCLALAGDVPDRGAAWRQHSWLDGASRRPLPEAFMTHEVRQKALQSRPRTVTRFV